MQLQSAPNHSPTLKNSLSPSKCLWSLSLSWRDKEHISVTIFLSLLVEELLIPSPAQTKQSCSVPCGREILLLTTYVREAEVWSIALLSALCSSAAWEGSAESARPGTADTQARHSPRDTAGVTMRVEDGRTLVTWDDAKGPGLAGTATMSPLDCVPRPLSGKRRKLRAGTAQD